VLAHTLAYGPLTAPAAVFVGLCTTAPTAAVGGTEVAGGSYARVAVTFAAGTATNIAANAATVEFPLATADWGTIGHFELWDAITGGNRLYWGPLVDPVDGVTPVTRSITNGDIMRISAGALQVQAF
jgi:hypothetical protein